MAIIGRNHQMLRRMEMPMWNRAPEHTDEVLYEQGLIDTDLPLEKARERFRINDRAAKFADSEEFLRGVRE